LGTCFFYVPALVKLLVMKKLNDIHTFLVLGAGTLGLRVALQAALSGFNTHVYEISEKAIQQAKVFQAQILEGLVKNQIITRADADAAIGRMMFTMDKKEACLNVDFVNESVTENLDLKRKVWQEFSELLPEDCILTTNTSYLLPSQLTGVIKNPSRFCSFHFHDVFLANVVDIMPHKDTAPEMVDLLYHMGYRLHQIPVLVNKEWPGYIFNHMLAALMGAAFRLATQGVASVQDIDRSWMGNFHMPSGPFGIMDTIGLDTVYHVTANMAAPGHEATLAFLKPYIDAGHLGVKSGKGFYSYPKPAYRSPDFLKSATS
jgi:3-hydroxybutyryl-CoA dehydrogenase